MAKIRFDCARGGMRQIPVFEVSDFHAAWRGENLVGHIARIQHASRLEAKDFGFLVGTGPMFGSAGHHEAFARLQSHDVVSEFDAKTPLANQEELVFVPMVVPGKLAQYLDDLDFLAIQSRDDLGPSSRDSIEDQ